MSEFQTKLHSVPSGGFLTDRDKDKKPILDVREPVSYTHLDVYKRQVACLVGHLDGLKGLGHRADLVQLDEDGVARAQRDALGQTLSVGDEQVVAHQLDLIAQLAGHLLSLIHI